MGWPFSISKLQSQMEHCKKEMICWIRFDSIGVLRKYSQILFEKGRKSILSPVVHSDWPCHDREFVLNCTLCLLLYIANILWSYFTKVGLSNMNVLKIIFLYFCVWSILLFLWHDKATAVTRLSREFELSSVTESFPVTVWGNSTCSYLQCEQCEEENTQKLTHY